jgi:hypothetical protein
MQTHYFVWKCFLTLGLVSNESGQNGLLGCGKHLLGILKANLQKKQGICLLFFLLFFAARSYRWMDLERKCGL